MRQPSPPLPAAALHDALTGGPAWLHDSAASRSLETQALAQQPAPGHLMALAGLSVARLALAITPRMHADQGCVWVLAGPGNNGGDGLVAARQLHQAGRRVRVVQVGDTGRLPADARQAFEAARDAGVPFSDAPPASGASREDLIVDALLGLGQSRPPDGPIATLVAWQRQQAGTLTLAVDLPTGLCADTGRVLDPSGELAVQAQHTLSLLTLKPGLFTHHGRDLAGRIWLDTLGQTDAALAAGASAGLLRSEAAQAAWPARHHAQHKGSFGDLWVIAGAQGMTGAAWLAARAALAGGAGRVYLAALSGATEVDPLWPELMQRTTADWQKPGVLEAATVVCGCGGGGTIAALLPEVLARAGRLVLDADALNAIAASDALLRALQQRRSAGLASVLTPHPLEAARLAGVQTAEIQQHRLQAAQALALRCGSVVLLKGAGTVIAGPAAMTCVNASGNARLATPGSGDVLAGWLGAAWSAMPTPNANAADTDQRWQAATLLAMQAAGAAAWVHGAAAEIAPGDLRLPLRASQLVAAMTQLLQPAP